LVLAGRETLFRRSSVWSRYLVVGGSGCGGSRCLLRWAAQRANWLVGLCVCVREREIVWRVCGLDIGVCFLCEFVR